MNAIFHIQLGEQSVPVRLEKTRGRSIRLLYKAAEKTFVLRTPSGELTSHAKQFVQSKQGWMAQVLSRNAHKDQRAEQFHLNLEGGKIPLMGQAYLLERRPGTRARFEYQPDQQKLLLTVPHTDQAEWKPYLREGLKKVAKKVLVQRTFQLADATQSTVRRVFIKGQKTRWGSCSTQANINLNWHLLFLAEPLIDYVIIHELMHLREMNHSPRFWAWVEQFYPGYKQAEKRIHEQAWMIGVLGK